MTGGRLTELVDRYERVGTSVYEALGATCSKPKAGLFSTGDRGRASCRPVPFESATSFRSVMQTPRRKIYKTAEFPVPAKALQQR